MRRTGAERTAGSEWDEWSSDFSQPVVPQARPQPVPYVPPQQQHHAAPPPPIQTQYQAPAQQPMQYAAPAPHATAPTARTGYTGSIMMPGMNRTGSCGESGMGGMNAMTSGQMTSGPMQTSGAMAPMSGAMGGGGGGGMMPDGQPDGQNLFNGVESISTGAASALGLDGTSAKVMGAMASQAASQAAMQYLGTDQLEGMARTFTGSKLNVLRYYFDVNNAYVLQKASAIQQRAPASRQPLITSPLFRLTSLRLTAPRLASSPTHSPHTLAPHPRPTPSLMPSPTSLLYAAQDSAAPLPPQGLGARDSHRIRRAVRTQAALRGRQRPRPLPAADVVRDLHSGRGLLFRSRRPFHPGGAWDDRFLRPSHRVLGGAKPLLYPTRHALPS